MQVNNYSLNGFIFESQLIKKSVLICYFNLLKVCRRIKNVKQTLK